MQEETIKNVNKTGECIFIHPSQDFESDLGFYVISKKEPDLESKKQNTKFSHTLVASDGRVLCANDKTKLHTEANIVLHTRPSGLLEERWKHDLIDQFSDDHGGNDPYQTFATLKETIKKYIELKDEEWYSIIPLWIMGTYCYTVFPAFPYLAIHGFKGSGKSKLGDLVARLAFNGLGTVGISEASLFRIVEANRATLIIDEGEQLNSRNNHKADSIRQLLNAGYRKGTKVIRQMKDKNGNFEPQAFDPYSPKVIVSIAGLEDVLGSRAITIIMMRATGNKGFKQLSDTSESWDELRDPLYRFGLEHYRDVRIHYDFEEDVRVGKNRANDLWAPILAIGKIVFKDNEEEYEKIKNFAKKHVESERIDEDMDDITYALVIALEDLVIIEGWYSSTDIYNTTCKYLESAIVEQMKNNSIGYRMKRLGIKKKRQNDGTKYHLHPDQVKDLMDRFSIKR